MILLSGSGLANWAVQKNPLSTFKQLADALNCSFDQQKDQSKFHKNSNQTLKQLRDYHEHKLKVYSNTDENVLTSKHPKPDKLSSHNSNPKTLECLRRKSFADIVNVPLSWPKYRVGFGPIIDKKTVLPSSIKKLTLLNCPKSIGKKLLYPSRKNARLGSADWRVENKSEETTPNSHFGELPLLIGGVATAGSDFLLQEDLNKPISNLRSAQVLRTFVRNNYRYHRQKIYDILAHNYYDWDRPNNSKASLKSLVDLITDGILSAPAVKLAEMHSECGSNAHTFFYSLGSTGLESRNEAFSDQSINRHQQQHDAHKGSQQHSKTHKQTTPHRHSDYISFGPAHINNSVFFPEGLSSEMAYFLGAPLVDGLDPFSKDFSVNERLVSEYLLKYVFNFVRTG